MELRDVGVLVSFFVTIVSVAYTLGQLKGNYVTKEAWRDIELRLSKAQADSQLQHAAMISRAEVDNRFAALGIEIKNLFVSVNKIQAAVEKIRDKLWATNAPPKLEGE